MAKRLAGVAVKLLVTAGLFVLLFRPATYGFRADLFGGVTPASLWGEVRDADLGHMAAWLLFAALVKLCGMLAGVVRWRLLLEGQGLRIPFWQMVQSWFVGRSFGIFLPGTIGLDGYRLYDSARRTGQVIKCTTVIAVEKLIGFVALTFLVFLTFPLGFRLLHINVALLSVILAALGAFVAVSFLLLLNPRVIQVLVAVLPVPASIRAKVDTLGAAVTAYSGRRGLLLAAVLCGLLVHAGTCFMFFGTMMSIRAENTSLLDILFASPIMIYGTVIGPSVGGEGIREIVFAMLLGSKSGVAPAVLFAHLGWWVGELLPALIGFVVFVVRTRPSKESVQEQLAAARRENAEHAMHRHLAPDELAAYRRSLADTLSAGFAGGLLGGAVLGLAEAGWLVKTFGELTELSALWWGPLVYGLVFCMVGGAVACGLAFVYLLCDRFPRGRTTFALSMAVTGAVASAMALGVWFFMRDLLGHAPRGVELVKIAGGVAAAGLGFGVLGLVMGRLAPRGRTAAVAAALVAYALLVLGGKTYTVVCPPQVVAPVFAPKAVSKGPNIILVAADALRADYLPAFNPAADARTPSLQALAGDSVLFERCFAQAPWTKPAFASIFSSRYAGAHKTDTKTAALPKTVTTFPELLASVGYYTKGFANNGNIMSTFNFNKGFADYVDLKPRRYFGASYSASRLALYEGLRHARHVLVSKFTRKMDVTDFYQPAETVTREALTWLDDPQRPKDAPFFLFLHYMDPHDPFMDHEHPGVGYARVRMPHPDAEKFLDPMRRAYISEIEYMDGHLGALLDGLRERGLYDGTLVVFTADHGEEFYEHKGWWHGQSLFDEVLHIPLMFKLPNATAHGARVPDLVRQIDVAPTLLRFAGVPPTDGMSGKALLDEGGQVQPTGAACVYSENNFEDNVMQSVRTADAKLIRANADNPRGHAPVEFYDLAGDPGERANRTGRGDARESQLNGWMDGMLGFLSGAAAEPSAPVTLSREAQEQLNAIGYGDSK